MTIEEIYQCAYQYGMEKDYRPMSAIREVLKEHAHELLELCKKAAVPVQCPG